MGLFNFIKGVGTKIFGGGEAQAADAGKLQAAVESSGLKADGLNVQVNGDKVTVSGNAMSTEDAEKIILALGNTAGVAQVESNLAVQREQPAATMYTVQKGDTLWAIAEKHYGKGKGADYKKILAANMPPVKDEDMIQPGWVLRIPPAETKTA